MPNASDAEAYVVKMQRHGVQGWLQPDFLIWRCAQVGVDNIRAHMEKHAAEAETLAKRRLELSRQARLRS